TILAEQHFRTFSARMADYPVSIECLSRFRPPGEQKRIVDRVKSGRTDIVIGTHRLLSDDVGFRNLGLVIIDEEQKFGVESKERLKNFRSGVDILTMTATPIPRTLHMSLLGLRDISNLATAPRERHSVKTMVARWSKEIVRRAILRELARGGQCFFLHNRVHNIDEMAAELRQVVPEARFGVGHGQMTEGELLEIMRRFLDGKIDVLVCTTIIESGVDIPNVNTLFVNGADHFGLSELHQLRGRVGRYKHQAYAYFLTPEKRPVSPEAAKRLDALQEYAELGAGFRIAMRDLEIRGAGNLLGIEQSGHIHMIGFDLYCRLLEKAVAAEKGEPPEEEAKAELDLGSKAFIPPEYIPSEQQRIEFYRRLTRIRSKEDIEVNRSYVRDRYGPPPPPVERCFRDQEIRLRMINAGVEVIGRLDSALILGFSDNAARRGVMLMRHAGLKITPLRQNQWRVEMPGIDLGLEPGDYAAGMADKALAILEAGGKAKRHRPAPEKPDTFISRNENKFLAASRMTQEPKPGSRLEPPLPKASPSPAVRKKKKGKSNPLVRAKMTALTAKPGKTEAISAGTSRKPAVRRKMKPLPSPPAPEEEQFRPTPPETEENGGGDAFDKLLDSSAGVKVLGIEPYIADGQIGAVVPETAFNPIRHETMTLVVKSDPEQRFFLPCVGLGVSPGRRAVLKLRAANATEAQAIAEAYLLAGTAVLFDGVAE
ncbi:MAG: hypothetical protein FWG74_03145, partial [Planctomycetes bacterium]|nr:hypothetical protein [Planctomycetota bacterium]